MKKRRLRTIPYFHQTSWNDCGIACLQMVLAFHGKAASREELISQIKITRNGVTALALLSTARRYGLRGRGIRMTPGYLPRLERGAILHWERSHFIVFDRPLGGRVRIVDPKAGRRSLPMEFFDRDFSGVALSFRAPRD